MRDETLSNKQIRGCNIQLGQPIVAIPHFTIWQTCQQQFEKGTKKKDNRKILSSTETEPFIRPNRTATNPNAITYSNYFVDGPGVVAGDGTLFDLTNTNQSKSSTRDKNFLATFPKLYGEQSHIVRKWYQEVLDHCTRLNLYLHPYYLFRKEADHICGFTIGDSDADDPPSKFQWSINTWSVLIFTAIWSEKLIP